MQTRRDFIVTTAKAGLVTATLATVGCGGGSNNSNGDAQTIRTNFGGVLADVSANPAPGAVFIGRGQSFEITWPFSDPPREFTVALRRFLEPIGGQPFDTPTQKISITQRDDRTWEIFRRDGFDLDANAVYFLDLNASGGQEQRFVYITSNNRSVTFNTPTNGSVNDVQILPLPGTYGISRSVGSSGFELQWPDNSFPPPSQFTVKLRRFKEKRGDDNGGDSEQETEGDTDNNNFIYVVRRKNRFQLDGVAAYYLEISAGATLIRSAFTTAT